MKKTLALFFALLFIAPYAAADGMMFIEDHDMWNLQPEENQMAAIHYEGGMENMLISVSPGKEFAGDRAVWIFPIPARPESVKVDVLKGYPRYTGNNFEDNYIQTVATATGASVLYATFPVSLVSGAAAIIPMAVFGMAGSLSRSSGIEVYDRVEKMGVVTEVVAASDADALNNFLILRGMQPSAGGKELLASYIGKDYTFVVTSIGNVSQYREATKPEEIYYDYTSGMTQANMIGVFVRFPTDHIYFPLRPTSVYGAREVPVLVYVTGFVNPALYDTIRQSTEITYFTQGYYTPPSQLAPFFNNQKSFDAMQYTKIKIVTTSDRFTEDLWIDPSPPPDMVIKETYLSFVLLISVIAYVVFSAIASLLAGMLVFRRKKAVGTTTLLLHGLWNCLTFIGFAIATRKKFPQEEYGKRGPYILAFYAIFGLLLSAFTLVLAPSLAFGVLLGWAIALLFPLVSLVLLFGIPMLFPSPYSMNALSLIVWAVASAIILVLAFCPVPVLLWLKRWMDPETGAPSPGLPATLVAYTSRVVPDYAALADYEKRWGRVIAIALAVMVLSALLIPKPYGPILTTLGLWIILVAVLVYAATIFENPGHREKVLAMALVLVPLIAYEFLIVMPPLGREALTTLISCLILAGILLGAAVILRRLVLYRAVAAVPVPPDLRMVILVILLTSILLSPAVIMGMGMENPRAQYLIGQGDQFTERGEYAAARDAYEEALMINPKSAPAYEHLGDMHLKWGSCYQGLDNYEHAMRLAPDDTRLRAKYEKAVAGCGWKIVQR